MKTEYREHPLGAPGLTARLKGDPTRPPRTPAPIRLVGRVLARLARWTGLG